MHVTSSGATMNTCIFEGLTRVDLCCVTYVVLIASNGQFNTPTQNNIN